MTNPASTEETAVEMIERDWRVTWGYYSDRECYRGPNTWLAGLNYARAHRKGRRVDVGGSCAWVLDQLELDEGGDRKTEDEQAFFDECAHVGTRFSWRSTWKHSRNWR